jgi:hypothetical protein
MNDPAPHGTPPRAPSPSGPRPRAAIGLLGAAYAAVFLAFYPPPVWGISDEIGFVNQARVWSRGAVSSEGAGLPFVPMDFVAHRGRHVPARHPGRSLLILPFLAAGRAPAMFLTGLALHLLMTAAAARLLERLGRSPLWAVLLLFHPTLAVYSRTVMADGAAGTGLLLAALAVEAGRPAAAGLAVAAAAAMRSHAALALPLVAAAFLAPARPRPRPGRAARCLAAGAAGGAALAAYNLAVYGRPVDPFTAPRAWFSARFLGPNLVFYEVALMAVWPGLLLAPALDRSRLRWLTRGVIALFLGPLLFYSFHDRGPGWLETQVLGQRLVQVALPLWVVAYAGVADDLAAAPLRARLGPRARAGLTALACLALLGANALASFRHQRRLEALADARDALRDAVPPGAMIAYQGELFKAAMGPDGAQLYDARGFAAGERPWYFPEVTPGELDRAPRPWYLAALKPRPDAPLSDAFREAVARHGLRPVPTASPRLVVYRAGAPTP